MSKWTREDFEEPALLLEPEFYDKAIIGKSMDGNVVYSWEKVVQCGVDDMGMEYHDSVEYHEFNTFQAYMGEGTPVFIFAEVA